MSASLEPIRQYLSGLYAKQFRTEEALLARMYAEGPPIRKHHHRPPTEAEVAAFEAWKVRFADVMREGDENHWILYDYDMDPEPVEQAPRVLEYDESKEEWEARLAAWREAKEIAHQIGDKPRYVSFPIYHRPSEDDLLNG